MLKIAVILLAIGIFNGLSVLGYHLYTIQKAAAYNPSEIVQATTAFKPEQFAHNIQYRPVKITIDLLLEKEITAQEYKNGVWTIADTTVAHLVTSAFPYEPGNIILYGHNTQAVFANLKKIQLGNAVRLTLQNGAVRSYTVTEITEVTPDKVQYLQPTTTETVTIYTCAGFMDSKRLIVRAIPKE